MPVLLFKGFPFLLRIDSLKADFLYFETFSLIQPIKLFLTNSCLSAFNTPLSSYLSNTIFLCNCYLYLDLH